MKFIKVRHNANGRETQIIINKNQISEIYEKDDGARIYLLDDDNIITMNTIDELFEMLNK